MNDKQKPIFQMSADTKIIRAAFAECDIGNVVTYESLDKAIGRDVRKFAMGSIQTARRSLLRDDRYVFECVTNVGYQRLDNAEIVAGAERDRRRVSRSTTRALQKLSCVVYDKLTHDQKIAHTTAAAQFGVLQMMAKRSTTKRIESKVGDKTELAIGDTLKFFT